MRVVCERLSWTVVVPLAALIALALTWGREMGSALVVLAALLLAGAVLAAVQHAEVVAHRVGEPLGSLVLAIAVTVIEVALIITLMASGGEKSATLARDTVFAAAMITMTGIVGLSLLIGSLRYGVTLFNAEGSGALLATVTTLATLSLVLPTFTTSHPGPEFTPSQLMFAAVASLGLYVVFVFTQTMRHRNFFLPVAQEGVINDQAEDGAAAEHPLHADQPRDAGSGTGRGRRPRQDRVAADRECGDGSRIPTVLRRRGDRGAGAVARDIGGGTRGMARAHTDQPQPCLRIGDGQHRADHSDACGGVSVV